MGKCLYCDRGFPPEHFICEVCGDGMCEACYEEDKEHEFHIQDPADLDWEMEEYAEIMDLIFKGGYGCGKCVDRVVGILNKIKKFKQKEN